MAAFVPTAWVDDSAPAISAAALLNINDGIAAALDFTEKWQALTIGATNTWTSVALSGYGVAEDNLVQIVFICKGAGDLYGGARKVGSSLQRRETVDGNGGTFTLTVKATGATAAVELYTENTTNCVAYLAGYWGLS